MPTGLDTEAVPGRTASTDLRDPVPLLLVGGTGRSDRLEADGVGSVVLLRRVRGRRSA